MTHLPLTLGEYTTASGPVTITRIGRRGKWAFGREFPLTKWHVETGEHSCNERFDITGRFEPGVGQTFTVKAFSLADDETPPKAPLECWMIRHSTGNLFRSERSSNPSAVRMIEAAPIEADLARVTAERDEAVALLRIDPWNIGYADWTGRCRAFLAKIGVQP